MKKFNDRMLLESLVRKYGKDHVENIINKLNEKASNTIILHSCLPNDIDQYRDAYNEDVEIGEINPKKMDYYTYADRLNQLYEIDLEDDIKNSDNYNLYVVINRKDKKDVEVYKELWAAIRSTINGDDYKLSFNNDHLDIEIAHYNSQNRSYYKIYPLNDMGEDLYYNDEDVYYGHTINKLNNKKYWTNLNLKFLK